MTGTPTPAERNGLAAQVVLAAFDGTEQQLDELFQAHPMHQITLGLMSALWNLTAHHCGSRDAAIAELRAVALIGEATTLLAEPLTGPTRATNGRNST